MPRKPKPPAKTSARLAPALAPFVPEDLLEYLQSRSVSLEDLQSRSVSLEDLQSRSVSLEDLQAPAPSVEEVWALARRSVVEQTKDTRLALIKSAIVAIEAVAFESSNKRQRERLAGFRRYLESLATSPKTDSEEEIQAKREGKRIGRKAFAALVGVSPKTLLDWHSAGVFDPAYIDEKGWRFYTFEQVAKARAILRERKRKR